MTPVNCHMIQMKKIHSAIMSSTSSAKRHRAIAFFVFPILRFPRNNREYYLTEGLLKRSWKVLWLVPQSGVNEGVPVDRYILRYPDMDVRGRTYLLPIYLGWTLHKRGISFLWLSGWSIRSLKEIYWLITILRYWGIRVIYDPTDPKCIFESATRELDDPKGLRLCYRWINRVYQKCAKNLFVTPELRELVKEHGADISNAFVARWGTDASVFNRDNRLEKSSRFRARFNIDEGSVLVGWMGSLAQFKGVQEMLLPLGERLGAKREIHLIIVGEGPLMKEIKIWAAGRERPRVHLLGRLPYAEAADFTAALDLYIVCTNPATSYARAICPIKCYDAIAMGVPLVTTRTPATEHLVRFSNNVHLCDFTLEDYERVVTAVIDQRLKTPILEKEAGPEGLISHQTVTPKIVDMLEKLAAGGCS